MVETYQVAVEAVLNLGPEKIVQGLVGDHLLGVETFQVDEELTLQAAGARSLGLEKIVQALAVEHSWGVETCQGFVEADLKLGHEKLAQGLADDYLLEVGTFQVAVQVALPHLMLGPGKVVQELVDVHLLEVETFQVGEEAALRTVDA